MNFTQDKNKIYAIGGTALVAGGILAAVLLTTNPTPVNNTSNNSSNTSTPTITATASAVLSNYKDGNYTADGTYFSPEGQERVTVNLTLEGNIVKDIQFTGHTTSSTSKQYQGFFQNNFKALVVGKKIDDVKLSVVSGSSLTSGGFNQAITKIKEQAKAS
jgi:uncharacterized protein with FMN-binding domain